MNAVTELANSGLLARVCDVVGYQMGVPVGDLKPETKFIDDLGADSLDQIEIVMALEDEFAVVIDDEKAERLLTIQQAVDYLASVLPA